MAIKTCLFDLGNVLLFFSHEQMCRQLAEVTSCPESDVRAAVFDSGLQTQLESGEISPEEFHARVDRTLGSTSCYDDFIYAGSAIFRANDEMFAVVDELRARSVRLVVLSNTCGPHIEFVRSRYDLLDRFDHLVLSHEVGAMKPADAIYRTALESIRCEPHECFYTDDIPAYVEAARTFGIDAEVFQSAADTRAHLQRRLALD